jgi:hypothetical protein
MTFSIRSFASSRRRDSGRPQKSSFNGDATRLETDSAPGQRRVLRLAALATHWVQRPCG